MKNLTKLSVGLFLACAASVSVAKEYKVPVIDTNNNKVMTKSNDCLRSNTIIKMKNDPCMNKKSSAFASKVDETIYIQFGFDKYELDNESKLALIDLKDRLHSLDESVNIVVSGYADRIGDPNYNHRLSIKRASSVAAFLNDIYNSKVHVVDTRGLGETNSITHCENISTKTKKISCLAPDRRAEIKLIYNK